MALLSLALLLLAVLPFTVRSKVADLVLLEGSGEAVCLDGSAPGYYYRAGSDADKWILHMEGGGWCSSETDCLARSKTYLGSSKTWPSVLELSGFLSDSPATNPDFHTWNVVFMAYCDGASFTNYRSQPVNVGGTFIYYRGYKILQSILSALLRKGLSEAKEVILTGCSAGASATFYHADYVRTILPASVKYRALADAGYFIDAPNIYGQNVYRAWNEFVYKLHNSTGGVNQKCVNAYGTQESWKCLLAQHTYQYIETPIFVFNSQYDSWQLANILQLPCQPPFCTAIEYEEMAKFYEEFKAAITPVTESSGSGYFLDSCYTHCQSLDAKEWADVRVGGQSASETFANWYYNRSKGQSKERDCPYPCNKSC